MPAESSPKLLLSIGDAVSFLQVVSIVIAYPVVMFIAMYLLAKIMWTPARVKVLVRHDALDHTLLLDPSWVTLETSHGAVRVYTSWANRNLFHVHGLSAFPNMFESPSGPRTYWISLGNDWEFEEMNVDSWGRVRSELKLDVELERLPD